MNEINLFNNHVLIVAPVTVAPAGATPPSGDSDLFFITRLRSQVLYTVVHFKAKVLMKAIFMHL